MAQDTIQDDDDDECLHTAFQQKQFTERFAEQIKHAALLFLFKSPLHKEHLELCNTHVERSGNLSHSHLFSFLCNHHIAGTIFKEKKALVTVKE